MPKPKTFNTHSFVIESVEKSTQRISISSIENQFVLAPKDSCTFFIRIKNVLPDEHKKAGYKREPRSSVSRSIFALVSEQDRCYLGQEANRTDKIGMIEQDKRAIFGRSYAAEPDQLIKELAEYEAIQEADTVLLTIPNTLGV